MIDGLPANEYLRDYVRIDAALALALIDRTEDAMAMASRIGDPDFRALAYEEIAIELATKDKLAAARKAYAEIVMSGADEDIRKVTQKRAFRYILRAWARTGDVEGAEAQLAFIPDPLQRRLVAHDLVGAQAATGDLEGALQRLEEIREIYSSDLDLSTTVYALIRVRRFDDVERVLILAGNRLSGGYQKILVTALARAGRYQQALKHGRNSRDRYPETATHIHALLLVAEMKMKGR